MGVSNSRENTRNPLQVIFSNVCERSAEVVNKVNAAGVRIDSLPWKERADTDRLVE